MPDMLSLCSSRKDEITGEIFELLVQFTDFLAFKEMMLDYKAVSCIVMRCTMITLQLTA
jgi:ADP-ribosylation factor-like protein 2-binding protein